MLKPFMPYIIGAGALIVVLLAIWGYGHYQYKSGADDKAAEIQAKSDALALAMQEEKERADAQYRGAVLARQQVEQKLAKAESDKSASATRIAGLLRQLKSGAKLSSTSSGLDGTGPDWIGVFGECVARVDSLTSRLGQVGKDAAGFADKVNGLQGFAKSLRASQ